MRIVEDSGLSGLLQPAEETQLCSGFGFTEGPVWIPSDNCLLFSDIRTSRIHRWRPGTTTAEVYREPSRHANGLALDNDGNVLTCEHAGRQISIAEYNGPTRPFADRFEGGRFNSPNDIVVHGSGAVYFTDPNNNFRDAKNEDPDGNYEHEVPYTGVYRVGIDGAVTCIEPNLAGPNGLVFSPDESVLYINDSRGGVINRYDVQPDGSLGPAELFIDMRGDERPGGPDGMKVDVDGRLWATGPGGVWVVDSDGNRVGIFEIAEQVANLAWGGPERTTLYCTATTSVYSLETVVAGAR